MIHQLLITVLWFNLAPIKFKIWLLAPLKQLTCRDLQLLKVDQILKEDREAQEANKLKSEDSFMQCTEEVCPYKETVIMPSIKTEKDF